MTLDGITDNEFWEGEQPEPTPSGEDAPKKEAVPAWVTVPVYRGFTEIIPIWDICQQTGSIIAGGYVRYMCAPTRKVEPAGDVDLFPRDEAAFRDNIKQFVDGLGFSVRHENNMAVTLNNPKDQGYWSYCPTVQIIKPVKEGHIVALGTLEEILDNFDFTVVRIGLISGAEALADGHFLEDEQAHRLRFQNIHCPVSSTLRAMKYAKKGYWLPPVEALKLFQDWDARTDDYRSRLVELFEKSAAGEMPKEQIDELEDLLRVD